jgi:hypothetical protein
MDQSYSYSGGEEALSFVLTRLEPAVDQRFARQRQ